ncbi:MAG: efflux RND transporter periplasmic adaptor subunit [bacterium]
MITEKQNWYVTLICIVGIALLVPGCAEEQKQSKKEDVIPVQVTPVTTDTLEQTVEVIGTIQSRKKVVVKPEISGVLQSVHFKDGDTVSSGEVMLEIDKEKLKARLKARKGGLQQARAQLENARRTYERMKKLFKRDAVSAQDRDDALEAYQQAQGRVERLKAEVEEARERLNDATIKSPFNGRVGALKVDQGNFVQPGEPLVELYKSDPLEVSFSVPESYSDLVEVGQTVRMTSPSAPDREFQGRVFFVSPSVEVSSRDLMLKAELTDASESLRPGSYAQVELVLNPREQRAVIPSAALIPVQKGYFVFRVEQNKAIRQPVQIGMRKPGWVEVTDGLTPGDTIIRTGHQSVSDGASVRAISPGE